MNAFVSRRALLGATAAVGVVALPVLAEAGIPVSDHTHPDAALFRLLDGLPALKARRDTTEARQDALWAEFCEREPDRPDALRVRTADGFNVSQCEERDRDGRYAWFYDMPAGEELAELPSAALDCDEVRDGAWIVVPDEGRIARRAEIMAALAAWWAACDVVKAHLGIPAADEEAEVASDALQAAWDAIMATTPQTFAGLFAKARWATAADVPTGWAERWERRVAADVVALADRDGVAL